MTSTYKAILDIQCDFKTLDQKIGRASTSYQRLVESIQDLTLLGQQGVLMRHLWCPVSTVQCLHTRVAVSGTSCGDGNY